MTSEMRELLFEESCRRVRVIITGLETTSVAVAGRAAATAAVS